MRKSAPKIGKGHAPTTYRCKVGGRGRFDKLKALSPRWGSVRAVINWLTRRFESLASTALRPVLQALPVLILTRRSEFAFWSCAACLTLFMF